MSLASANHQWLHLNFPVPARKHVATKDAVAATYSHNLRGRRVWTKFPIVDWSRGVVAAEPNCGGTVAFHDADDHITVRWDSGTITIHGKDELLRTTFLIGGHKTLQDHLDCLAGRCKCKKPSIAAQSSKS